MLSGAGGGKRKIIIRVYFSLQQEGAPYGHFRK